MRSVFFSDVHARGSADDAGGGLPGFLRSVGSGLDHLFVVGDLFDFWFSREGVVYPGFRPVIDEMASLQRNGVQVHLFEGNHDFFLADYFFYCGPIVLLAVTMSLVYLWQLLYPPPEPVVPPSRQRRTCLPRRSVSMLISPPTITSRRLVCSQV